MYVHRVFKSLLPHGIAAGVALTYAWFIFQSSYVKTGLQFVAPVIFILTVHLLWLGTSGQLTRGFSKIALRRSSNTTLIMALGIVAFSMIAPKPASASPNAVADTFAMLLGVVVCLAMLAVVLFVLFLMLRVMERTENAAVFHVLSDTSPIANWVSHKTLTFRTQAIGNKTQLDVTLTYDRDLAPSWFFTPVVKFSAYLAMGVLANDVKNRAELSHGS